jgi:hypothetical protein
MTGVMASTNDLDEPLVQPVDPTGRLSPAEFGGLFQSFTASAFRLETLSEYRVEESAQKVELFLKGTPLPPDGNDAWCQLVSAARTAGKRMSRVHVIPRRLTPYLRYEIEWGYVYSAEAGEEILLLPHDQPGELFATWPLPDFWLFDDGTNRRSCVRMHYDATGRFLFGQLVTDPSEIDTYRRARDVAIAHAVTLQQYLAEQRNS